MAIINVAKRVITVYYVETDKEDFPLFETDGKGNWRRVMGESAEEWYSSDELQKEFDKYTATHTADASRR